jgi:hypothetical protein
VHVYNEKMNGIGQGIDMYLCIRYSMLNLIFAASAALLGARPMNAQQKSDLAQLIAAAVVMDGVPRSTATGGGAVEEGEVRIGEVPTHLQHLHNLFSDTGEELRRAEGVVQQLRQRHEALHAVFFSSLVEHVAVPEGFAGVKLSLDWSVYAFKQEMHPLQRILGLG